MTDHHWAQEPQVRCRRCGQELGSTAILGLKPRTCTTILWAPRTDLEAVQDPACDRYTRVFDECFARMIERDTEELARVRAEGTAP